MTDPPAVTATRLSRRLGTFDAVVIGLGSMIGAGIFTALAPAAAGSLEAPSMMTITTT